MGKKIEVKRDDLEKDDYKNMDSNQLRKLLGLKISLNNDNSKSIKKIEEILQQRND